MSTVTELYAEIIKSPADDTLRGAYADALDERGERGDADAARFVRDQLRLHAIGKPRKVVEYELIKTHGARVYTTTVGIDEVDLGERVDLVPHIRREQDRRKKVYHGLKAIKFRDADTFLGIHDVVLVEDGDSVPFPRAEYDALMLDCRAQFARHHARDVKTVTDLGIAGPGHALYYERGFLSRVVTSWRHWRERGDGYCKDYPISRVELTDLPEIQHQPSRAGMSEQLREFAFGGIGSSPFFLDAERVRSLRRFIPEYQWTKSKDQEAEVRKITVELLCDGWPSVPKEGRTLPD